MFLAAFLLFGTAQDIDQRAFDAGYTCASYLSDPLLKAHRWRWQIPVTDKLYEKASRVEVCARKVFYGLGAVSSAICSVPSAGAGTLLRRTLISLQKTPFLYCQGNGEEKSFSNQFTLLSWNICCVPGGYSITDGSVIHWKFRIKDIAKVLKEYDSDVISLYEIFDIQTAHKLIHELKESYPHFYYCIGPKTVGPSSGLFVASKISIENPSFSPFTKEALDGRAKYSNKGVFGFTLQNKDAKKVHIFATHMGHSEVPDKPTSGELTTRKKQLDIIFSQMHQYSNGIKILTGDLNMEETEFNEHRLNELFDRGLIKSVGATWGGDTYSAANVTGKRGSLPTTLDYTMASKDKEVSLTTTYIETNYEGDMFKRHALSDHKGLFTEIILKD